MWPATQSQEQFQPFYVARQDLTIAVSGRFVNPDAPKSPAS